MYSYESFNKEKIGYSTSGILILAGIDLGNRLFAKPMRFKPGGYPGEMIAHITEADVEIPDDFKLFAEFTQYLRIYDDKHLVALATGDRINVYLSENVNSYGNYECIIMIGSEEEFVNRGYRETERSDLYESIEKQLRKYDK